MITLQIYGISLKACIKTVNYISYGSFKNIKFMRQQSIFSFKIICMVLKVKKKKSSKIFKHPPNKAQHPSPKYLLNL